MKQDLISDLLASAGQSGDCVDFGAAIASASLALDRIIDQIVSSREEENG